LLPLPLLCAQVALLGFFAQHAATGKGPLEALGEHLASPWTVNFATESRFLFKSLD
jgi:hypothetical protein